MYNITVLMSTYNGEKYLTEQIDSILDQKGVNVKLVIRDDMSSDDSRSILKNYQDSYDNITVIEAEKNLGACGSFFDLICNNSDTEFFALSDQDDVWDDDKLITAITKLKKYPSDIPLLYFSNLRVVDAELNQKSMFYTEKLSVCNKYSGMIETYAAGCTMVYNKRMAEIAKKARPTTFSMHDVWLFNVASIFGRIIFDNNAHISYRQHENNVIGASIKKSKADVLKDGFARIFRSKEHPYSDNARIFYSQFKYDLKEPDKKIIKELAEYRSSFIYRLNLLFCRKLRTKSLKRNLKFKALLICGLA